MRTFLTSSSCTTTRLLLSHREKSKALTSDLRFFPEESKRQWENPPTPIRSQKWTWESPCASCSLWSKPSPFLLRLNMQPPYLYLSFWLSVTPSTPSATHSTSPAALSFSQWASRSSQASLGKESSTEAQPKRSLSRRAPGTVLSGSWRHGPATPTSCCLSLFSLSVPLLCFLWIVRGTDRNMPRPEVRGCLLLSPSSRTLHSRRLLCVLLFHCAAVGCS